MLTSFNDLGVGVGLRPNHYNEFLENKPKSASWVEVISENFMDWSYFSRGVLSFEHFTAFSQACKNKIRPLQKLEQVRTDYPVVLHGVSLSIGSCESLDQNYLSSLKNLINIIEPAMVSDHLCWTGIHGENLHDLLPLPYTQEALELVVQKTLRVQEYLGRRILLENPSTYLQFSHSEMTEWEFIAHLAKAADCGILLDINNVYVSSVNHNFDPFIYLKSLPKEKVAQIHLAGHSKKFTNENNCYLIDTHDAPVCPEVWELYRFSINHFGKISAMIERDANIPEWEELERELLILNSIRGGENGKEFV